jgi:hypothetical protein
MVMEALGVIVPIIPIIMIIVPIAGSIVIDGLRDA